MFFQKEKALSAINLCFPKMKLSKSPSKVVEKFIKRSTTIEGTLLCKSLILFWSEIWNLEKKSENFFFHPQKLLTYSSMAKVYLVQKSDLNFNESELFEEMSCIHNSKCVRSAGLWSFKRTLIHVCMLCRKIFIPILSWGLP